MNDAILRLLSNLPPIGRHLVAGLLEDAAQLSELESSAAYSALTLAQAHVTTALDAAQLRRQVVVHRMEQRAREESERRSGKVPGVPVGAADQESPHMGEGFAGWANDATTPVGAGIHQGVSLMGGQHGNGKPVESRAPRRY